MDREHYCEICHKSERDTKLYQVQAIMYLPMPLEYLVCAECGEILNLALVMD